jgi:hypothetical protein
MPTTERVRYHRTWPRRDSQATVVRTGRLRKSGVLNCCSACSASSMIRQLCNHQAPNRFNLASRTRSLYVPNSIQSIDDRAPDRADRVDTRISRVLGGRRGGRPKRKTRRTKERSYPAPRGPPAACSICSLYARPAGQVDTTRQAGTTFLAGTGAVL